MQQGKIIPLNGSNLKQEKEESNDAKSLMMETMIDAAMNDPMIKDKVTKLFSLFAKPAFKQLLGMLGEDETRFMMYRDRDTGLVVFHKFKVKDNVDENETESSVIKDFSFTDPDPEKDIFTIDENDLESMDVLAKKIMSKFGMKMEF